VFEEWTQGLRLFASLGGSTYGDDPPNLAGDRVGVRVENMDRALAADIKRVEEVNARFTKVTIFDICKAEVT
jgi:hypothetical protein